MALILNIETSTEVCTLTLADNGTPIFESKCFETKSHASQLPLFVDEAMAFIQEKGYQLDAVAVSAGPGSYTGLRIGVSTAKGLCYALHCPLISVDTLQTIALGARASEGCVRAMIDARRMEVYTALYTKYGVRLTEPEAVIVDEHAFAEELQKGGVAFCGNGAMKCAAVIQHANARFVDGVHPMASTMAMVAEEKYQQGAFEDVAYFEPFYLKEYMAVKPKKMF